MTDPQTDFADADRGFVATLDDPLIRKADGTVVFDASWGRAVEGDAPETADASLWRQAGLTARNGLYEVAPGFYQVRGFDISNTTLVEGETGVIVIDPFLGAETAAAGLALYRRERGDRPVTAVIYTHAHIDHFGGVLGVVDADTDVPIVAPEHFLEHAVSENVYAGTAMLRRSVYYDGHVLPKGARGTLGIGLGPGAAAATVGLIAPTLDITHTGQEEVLDGVRIVFQLTPNTESPAEMNFFFPDHRCCAWRRTPPTRCTTSSRCAARRCATRGSGRGTSRRPWSCSRTTPTSSSPRTTGPRGAPSGSWRSSSSSATCTRSSTTRRCGS